MVSIEKSWKNFNIYSREYIDVGIIHCFRYFFQERDTLIDCKMKINFYENNLESIFESLQKYEEEFMKCGFWIPIEKLS